MRVSRLASVRALAAIGIGSIVIAFAPRVAHAQCAVPGFSDAAFGQNDVKFTGNGCTDSYNSTLGSYSTTKCSPQSSCNGGIGTNGSSSGSITLTGNACALGDCAIGYGGSTSDITTTGSAACNSESVEPATQTLPSVTAPTLPAASPSNVSAPAILTPNETYGAVTASGGTITLNTGTYVMSSLTLSGNGKLVVGTGPVIVYITGSGSALSLSGKGVVSALSPSDLMFMCTDSVTSASVTGNGTASFGLYCPKANISITGNGDIYGSIVGNSVTDTGNGKIHYDQALATVTTTGISCTQTELSRATPIVAPLTNSKCSTSPCDASVQGTFIPATGTATVISTATDVAGFSFPFVKGHMRAVKASALSTTPALFSGVAASDTLFDASTGIPSPTYSGCSLPVNGTCRFVFTNTNASATNGLTTFTTGIPDSDANVKSLSDTTATTIGNLIVPTTVGLTSTNLQTVIHDILSGSLGGVDRSTVAVIPASTLTTSPNRPTMVYFGADDGMLHAVCAQGDATLTDANHGGATVSSTGPVCPAAGTELWAFLPRVELPLIRYNEQRLDGSVHVLDAFGNWPACTTGQKCWRTILTFQTGYAVKSGVATAPAAAYALDVTDPAKPAVLWEYTTPPTPSTTYDFGIGLTVTAGPILKNNAIGNVAVLETRNGAIGTCALSSTTQCYKDDDCGASNEVASTNLCDTSTDICTTGSVNAGAACTVNTDCGPYNGTPNTNVCSTRPSAVVTEVDLTTGQKIWQFSPMAFSTPLPYPSGTLQTGVPGGAVGVDLSGYGFLTDIIAPDLAGHIWKLNALTGANQLGGTTPMFEFAGADTASTTDEHPIGYPPAIYSDGTNQYAAFTSGGYTDPFDGPWWHAGTQYLVAVKIANTEVTESGGSCSGCTIFRSLFMTDTNAQEYGWSQPLVVGDQLFVTSDAEDPNFTGFANGTVVSSSAHVSVINALSGALSYPTPTSIFSGVSGLAAGATPAGDGSVIVVAASNTKQQTIGWAGQTMTNAGTNPSGGKAVNLSTPAKVTRELWLRTE